MKNAIRSDTITAVAKILHKSLQSSLLWNCLTAKCFIEMIDEQVIANGLGS